MRVNGNGICRRTGWLVAARHCGVTPVPLSAAFGQRQDGSPVVAFGMKRGHVAAGRSEGHGRDDNRWRSPVPARTAIIAINPIPRFDGTAGGSDFAVSYRTRCRLACWEWRVAAVGREVARLTALPVSAGSPNTLTPDWDSFRAWYPGIKQGRFTVSNTSGEPITVALQTSPSPGSGCWYAPSWADAPAFPAAGITVAAGQTVGDVHDGRLHGG